MADQKFECLRAHLLIPQRLPSGKGGHAFYRQRRECFGFEGGQQDAAEALLAILQHWSSHSDGCHPALAPCGSLVAPCTSQCYQHFGIIKEDAFGCVACKHVSRKAEELLVLTVVPPSNAGGRTSVGQQVDNWGSPERMAEMRCSVCGVVGNIGRREYLRRVGPFLLAQLAIYDLLITRGARS